MKESELYGPLKQYFEAQGYKVSAEVYNADIVVQKDGEFYAIEMKTRFSLDLVYQLLRRRGAYDGVYAAVPISGGKLPRARDVKMLLSSLGFGLIAVFLGRKGPRVEILLQANCEYLPRRRHSARRRILREISGRYAELSQGGVPGSQIRLTAYRQQSLKVLHILLAAERPLSPKDIRDSGGPPRAQLILSRNVYGWFDRIGRGKYTVSTAGLSANDSFAETISSIFEKNK